MSAASARSGELTHPEAFIVAYWTSGFDPAFPCGYELLTDSIERYKIHSALKAALKALSYQDFLKTAYWVCVRQGRLSLQEPPVHCDRCGEPERNWASKINGIWRVQIHHKIYTHLGEEWGWLEDLEILCQPCHEDHHGIQKTKPADVSYRDLFESFFKNSQNVEN